MPSCMTKLNLKYNSDIDLKGDLCQNEVMEIDDGETHIKERTVLMQAVKVKNFIALTYAVSGAKLASFFKNPGDGNAFSSNHLDFSFTSTKNSRIHIVWLQPKQNRIYLWFYFSNMYGENDLLILEES